MVTQKLQAVGKKFRFIFPVMSVFFLCFFLSLVIVKTKSLHMGLTADTLQGVQKFHQGSVPRIGGLSIFFSLFVGTLIFDFSDLTKIKIIACFPVFVFGFIEDLFKSVPSLYLV